MRLAWAGLMSLVIVVGSALAVEPSGISEGPEPALPSGAIGPDASSHENVILRGVGKGFEWTTATSGEDVVVALAINAGQDAGCLLDFFASGWGEPSGLVFFTYEIGAGGIHMGWSGTPVEIHTPLISHAPPGPGYINSHTDLPVQGNWSFLLGGFNLDPIETAYSMRLNLECEKDVSFLGIRAVAVQTLTNGQGNSMAAFKTQPITASGAVQMEGGIEAPTWGSALFVKFAHFGPAVVEIEEPSEQGSYNVIADATIVRPGGPGTYTMRISHAGAGSGDLAGILLGFDVESPGAFGLEPRTMVWPTSENSS